QIQITRSSRISRRERLMRKSLSFAMMLVAIFCSTTMATATTSFRLDQQIKSYKDYLDQSPENVTALNKLAYLYTRKVRQTVDFSYNLAAEKLVQKALKLQPNNYDSLLNMAIIDMAQHRFADARDQASRAIQANPYGAGALGILGDAQYELGSYDAAA